MHLAIIGTGRVGQMLGFALINQPYITKLSLSDIKPTLTQAVAEELRHSAAGSDSVFEITACDNNEQIIGADIIIVTAGVPRNSKTKDRRDLIIHNSKIIKSIAETVASNNPLAKYIIVTNPVDAMSTLFSHYAKDVFVIGAGTSLDTLRFRSELAKYFQVPVNKIMGFVAGEHGQKSVFLWSTVKINGQPLIDHLKINHLKLDKSKIVASAKTVSKLIIDVIGGTACGPATAFTQIIRTIVLNQKRHISVATPYQVSKIRQPVFVSIPLKLGGKIGPNIEKQLTLQEKKQVKIAALAIYQTYQKALLTLSDEE